MCGEPATFNELLADHLAANPGPQIRSSTLHVESVLLPMIHTKGPSYTGFAAKCKRLEVPRFSRISFLDIPEMATVSKLEMR